MNGKVKFHPSIQLVKWQKYHNNKYIDINIHKPKYRGSTNDIANPVLEIHDFNTEDEVAYRLEVVTKGFKLPSHMYVRRLTTLRNSGAILFCLRGLPTPIKQLWGFFCLHCFIKVISICCKSNRK